MTTATVVSVSREDAVNLLTALKYGGASKYPTAKLAEKINRWQKEKDYPASKDLQNKDDKKTALLLNRIVKNLKDGATIEIGGAEEVQAEEKKGDESPAPKKMKKTPPSKNGVESKNGAVSKNGTHKEKEEKEDKPKKEASKRVGIVSTIRDLLRGATKKEPTTKEEILKVLVKKFGKEKEEIAMKATMNTWITDQFNPKYAQEGIKVHKIEKEGAKHYWAE